MDLVGVALVLEEFGHVIAPGGVGVVISSMAGHMAAARLTAEQERALATTPADEVLRLPFASPDSLSPREAYGIAKRANQLRVQAASVSWGSAAPALTPSAPA